MALNVQETHTVTHLNSRHFNFTTLNFPDFVKLPKIMWTARTKNKNYNLEGRRPGGTDREEWRKFVDALRLTERPREERGFIFATSSKNKSTHMIEMSYMTKL